MQKEIREPAFRTGRVSRAFFYFVSLPNLDSLASVDIFQLVKENRSADLHRLLNGNKDLDIDLVKSFECDWTSKAEFKGKTVGKGMW
jgi:hypothetical protein